ncbi:MAG: 30S ribosomal protein S20 [Candidatus Peribacteria bacterium]|nr:MAG: 30S ribosomal protein S20 [Candidatus Peribacteria bacterium]
MPIIKSAKKQLRQNKRNKAKNDFYKALYTEARKAFESAIRAGDITAAKAVFFNTKDKDGKNTKSGLQSIIDKLEKKNMIHANNAARKKSKFVKMLKGLEQA